MPHIQTRMTIKKWSVYVAILAFFGLLTNVSNFSRVNTLVQVDKEMIACESELSIDEHNQEEYSQKNIIPPSKYTQQVQACIQPQSMVTGPVYEIVEQNKAGRHISAGSKQFLAIPLFIRYSSLKIPIA